jgi:hypothetical protein
VTAFDADTVGCRTPLCDRPAVVYLGGPTLGRSSRLLILGGPRASLLTKPAALGAGHASCAECAHDAVDELLRQVQAEPNSEPTREEISHA